MKSKAAVRRIVEELKVLYPNARCSLEYKKDYELLFAVPFLTSFVISVVFNFT